MKTHEVEKREQKKKVQMEVADKKEEMDKMEEML